ncbi:hypothetical protein [Aliarcobacter cryaerophilus]|uniref:hypothetical protein n=1 Tax=Aliarcobacter cryaerophilus TaxID=28198 RepID=UPI0021B6CC5B|nr:hypothetical protein [Aliarcobacter cryaerophilus]MCT7498152.1 hypothetical protein [Aliarcobacter cryaerophilus]
MELYEKINLLLKEKNLNKKNFALKLIALEPKLKSTGEIPTVKAIYGYLSGDIALKIELIAYIGVFGQECRSSTGHFCNEIF